MQIQPTVNSRSRGSGDNGTSKTQGLSSVSASLKQNGAKRHHRRGKQSGDKNSKGQSKKTRTSATSDGGGGNTTTTSKAPAAAKDASMAEGKEKRASRKANEVERKNQTK